MLQGSGGRGEKCTAPAAIPTGCTKSGNVPFKNQDAQCRVTTLQLVGSPQTCQTATDDGDIRLGVTVERGARAQVIRDRRMPIAQVAVGGRAQSRFQASVSTRRRIDSISSNSAGPMVSGGAS